MKSADLYFMDFIANKCWEYPENVRTINGSNYYCVTGSYDSICEEYVWEDPDFFDERIDKQLTSSSQLFFYKNTVEARIPCNFVCM